MRCKYCLLIIILLVNIFLYGCISINESQKQDNKMLNDAERVILRAVNYENWYYGKWSDVWFLNDTGKTKVDFYIDSKDEDTIAAFVYKKIPDSENYYLLLLNKDAWGFGDRVNPALIKTPTDLEKEIQEQNLIKIGEKDVVLKNVSKPHYDELNEKKHEIIKNVETYILNNLKEDGNKGDFTLYIGNFDISRPFINVIIENNEQYMWIGQYLANKDESISSILPNDYEPIKTDEIKFYAEQVKGVALVRKVVLYY